MKLLVLVACAFVSASSSRLGGIDQISQLQTNGRIWGGRLANEGEIPYQVEVSIVSNQGAQSWCGGSIVSSNFVLSAAQCYTGNPTARVSGGRVDRANPLFVIAVAVIRNHPLFNPETFANDISLLALSLPIPLLPNVEIVRLPNRRQVGIDFLNQLSSFSGWGATGSGTEGVQFLHVGSAPVIGQTACIIRFPQFVNQNTLCHSGSAANFCFGDFGSPVTIRDADGITTQIGIASFVSPQGCSEGIPGGFTRLTQYLEWIGANSDVIIRDGFD